MPNVGDSCCTESCSEDGPSARETGSANEDGERKVEAERGSRRLGLEVRPPAASQAGGAGDVAGDDSEDRLAQEWGRQTRKASAQLSWR